MSSEMSLNVNAIEFVPTAIGINVPNISTILQMSYAEFQKGIQSGNLPTIVPTKLDGLHKPVLLRGTNHPYQSYGGWYDEERERMNMFDIHKFFDSGIDSVVSPSNQWIDYRLRELYELEEQQWMSQHLDIFMDREPVLW